MHDYHKAQDMVVFADARLKELGKSKVTKIFMTIGESSGYSAESVKMYFEEVSAGTPSEGAEVVVKAVKSMLECPKCGKSFPRKLGNYACPGCGTEGKPGRIGTEIVIEGIEAE